MATSQQPVSVERVEPPSIALIKEAHVVPEPEQQESVASVEPTNVPSIEEVNTESIDYSAPAKVEPEPEKVISALSVPPVPPAPAVPAKKAEPKPAAETKPIIPVREQRLLAYPETNYVLQLIGSVDEVRAREFVKRYINRMPVTYFETRLKGKPWFVVVTGPYNEKPAALAGIKVLPQELQKQRPWARSIAGVQKDIRENSDY